MADQAPWTIKAVPIETRQKALKAAHAQDQTMAQWLTDAVDRLADQQAANLVIPPGKPEAKPAVTPDIDLADFAAAVNAAVGATLAAGGKPPKALGRDAAAMIRQYARAARGLPPQRTRGQTIGQTIDENGQTPRSSHQLSVVSDQTRRPSVIPPASLLTTDD
ncbi:hypothetical protein [Rhodopila sp.]|uniref:hypothetical protein n=1 Tax=Rhodopila sp. TaxID=2480087 RepID=UPI003D0B1F69